MRIGVFCSYYNRPILFKRSLESVLEAGRYHDDWELAIGDDGSPHPAKLVIEQLPGFINRFKSYNTNATREEKALGIHRLGFVANQAIRESQADIGVFLCDDDLICPDYFRQLSDFYNNHPAVMYGHCDLFVYNPLKNGIATNADKYNKNVDNPVNHLDASQISFRLDVFRHYGVKFPDQSKLIDNMDSVILRQMYEKFGSPFRLPFTGQIKGIHDYQMMWNKKKDILDHLKTIDDLAGDLF